MADDSKQPFRADQPPHEQRSLVTDVIVPIAQTAAGAGAAAWVTNKVAKPPKDD